MSGSTKHPLQTSIQKYQIGTAVCLKYTRGWGGWDFEFGRRHFRWPPEGQCSGSAPDPRCPTQRFRITPPGMQLRLCVALGASPALASRPASTTRPAPRQGRRLASRRPCCCFFREGGRVAGSRGQQRRGSSVTANIPKGYPAPQPLRIACHAPVRGLSLQQKRRESSA